MPARLHLIDHQPGRPPVTLVLRSGGAALTFATSGGAVRSRPGDADAPDLVLAGPPQLIVGVLVGKLSLAEARARGLDADGDLAVLQPAASGCDGIPDGHSHGAPAGRSHGVPRGRT